MLSVELKVDDGEVRSDKDYEVPEHLADIIAFVDSVSNPKMPKRYALPSIEKDTQVDQGFVNDEVVAKLYNIVDNTGNADSSVGAMEYFGAGNGFSEKDLE